MIVDIVNYIAFSACLMNHTAPVRRVQRVRFEPRRRTAYVARTDPVGASFIRVSFTGDDLHDFQSLSFDDHVKVGVPGADGQMVLRDFTPRSFDATGRELTIEFALHAQGPASDWARRARPGDALMIAGPRGSFIVPQDPAWHLLAGDASALPAMARRLEELPPGTQAVVLVQVPDVSDRRALQTAANVGVQWVASGAEWIDALRALHLPSGEGYAWCAGEASLMKLARGVLIDQHRHPREALRVAAYWKDGVSAFHEKLDD
ncbi:siderophore-interacting protein [Schlegelella sp. S2-27]|uniref:Siderophore-interacting protein n=1 Tax=Caldimonas mangrovi TaxID=2944811 RepID=A0ABT0YVV7_9BURK|nr:siderophore-interacting protein [Caldimonas mangrovi]MCM5682723.1 siderophore-interacting protein [Caldimonas mangrovi]